MQVKCYAAVISWFKTFKLFKPFKRLERFELFERLEPYFAKAGLDN